MSGPLGADSTVGGRRYGNLKVSLWILGSVPNSAIPEAEILVSILIDRPPQVPGSRGEGFDLRWRVFALGTAVQLFVFVALLRGSPWH